MCQMMKSWHLWLSVLLLTRILYNFHGLFWKWNFIFKQDYDFRLFSAVYRPWNSYCIQIDNKSPEHFKNLMKKIVNCYESYYNSSVILSPSDISLVWQHSSLLEADLNCLEALLEKYENWKYYVNIVGSEFPLITNHQLIQKLNKVFEIII